VPQPLDDISDNGLLARSAHTASLRHPLVKVYGPKSHGANLDA
jgi:hypothetical protein